MSWKLKFQLLSAVYLYEKDVFCSAILFQEKPHHFLMQFPIGLIPHRQVNPGLFIYNTLIVGECVKTNFSVVSTHAAFAESSKSHFRGGQVNDGVINTSSAEAAAGSDFLCRHFVGGKEVKRQRMGHGIDTVNYFVQTVKSQDWHDRSEDFFLHDSIREGYIVQDSGFNAECFPVRISAMHDFLFVNQSQYPVKMFFINDFAVIVISERVFAILLLNLFFYFF